jgi:FAD/FMN-containing dehydrogenase
MAAARRVRTVGAMTQLLPSPSAVDELRFRLRGGLHEPGSAGYVDGCTLFNAMIERRPRYVARCAVPEDVVAAIAFARAHDLPIAVRGGGHSVAGASLVDDGVVLDVRGMDDVRVDPVTRVATVGGGATWAQVDRAAQAHGLATTGGRVSTTGVAGLTLGGGSGWLERKHGLACDNLVAATLVSADGDLVRVSAGEHPDLLWALRGGGGNFGVVCSLELALHPVGPEVLGGAVLHGYDRAADVLAHWRDLMADAPDELSLACCIVTVPDAPEFPAHLHGELGVLTVGLWCGEPAEGERVLAGLRAFGPPDADLFGPVAYADFQCAFDDPPGYRNYWTTEHLAELPDAAIAAIVEHGRTLPRGAAQLAMFCWGGAIARVPADATPLSGRAARWVIHPLLLWEDPDEDAAALAHGRAYRDLLAPWSTGAAYLNFIGDEGQGRIRAGYRPGDYERLARVKAAWDPDNVFCANQNIKPAV